jgi:hypothetical protein
MVQSHTAQPHTDFQTRPCSIANELAAMSRTDSRRQLEADMYRLYCSTHGGYANSKVGGLPGLGPAPFVMWWGY